MAFFNQRSAFGRNEIFNIMEQLGVQHRLERTNFLDYVRINTVVSIILFLALAFCLSFPLVYTINGVVFALIGLFLLFQRLSKKRPVIEKSFIGKLPMFFMFFAISGATIDLWHSSALGSYEVYIPFLWAPLIFLTIAEISIVRYLLWGGAAVGAMFAFCVALYQIVHLGIFRPEGFVLSPITFGNNALLLGALGAMGRYDPPRRSANWFWYSLTIGGLFAGVATSVMSQTRGGWPLIVIVLSWVFVSDFIKSGTKAKLGISSIFLVFILSVYAHPSANVSSRLVQAYTGFSGWLETGKPVEGSIGPRLELWRFGISTWSENPWIGHGQAGLMERKNELISEGKFDPMIGQFTALHNEFLQLLMQKGLAGVAGWALMFIAASGAFYHASKHFLPGIRCLGNAGLVVVIGSLVFGLTDMNLILNANRQIFVFLTMVIAGFITVEYRMSQTNVL